MAITLSKLISSVLVTTGFAVSLIAAPAHAKNGNPNGNPNRNNNQDTTETSGESSGETSSGIACDITNVLFGTSSATSCQGPFSGNDTGAGDPLLTKLNNGLFADDIGYGVTWSQFGKSDDGSGKVTADISSNGKWNLNKELLNGAQTFVISLKAANSYSAYLFEDFDFSQEGALEGIYNTIGTSQNGRGIAQGLSHASIFLANQPKAPKFVRAKVPEPANAIALGLVTGAMFMKRRRKSKLTIVS